MLPVIHMVQATSVLSSPRPLERLKRLSVIFHTGGKRPMNRAWSQMTVHTQPSPQHPGSSSFLVRTIWLSCISQISWFAVRFLSALSRSHFHQKWSIFIQSSVCMASSRRVANFTSSTMSPKATMTQHPLLWWGINLTLS